VGSGEPRERKGEVGEGRRGRYKKWGKVCFLLHLL